MCLCNRKSNGSVICCGQCDNSVLKELDVTSSGGGEQSEQNLSLPPGLAQKSKILQSAKEVEVVDIIMNSDVNVFFYVFKYILFNCCFITE